MLSDNGKKVLRTFIIAFLAACLVGSIYRSMFSKETINKVLVVKRSTALSPSTDILSKRLTWKEFFINGSYGMSVGLITAGTRGMSLTCNIASIFESFGRAGWWCVGSAMTWLVGTFIHYGLAGSDKINSKRALANIIYADPNYYVVAQPVDINKRSDIDELTTSLANYNVTIGQTINLSFFKNNTLSSRDTDDEHLHSTRVLEWFSSYGHHMSISTDTDGTDLQYTIFNAVSNTTDSMVKRVDMTWATFTGDYESDLGLSELKKDAAYGAYFGDKNSALHSYLLDNRSTKYCLRANQAHEGQYPDLQGEFYMNSYGGIDSQCEM